MGSGLRLSLVLFGVLAIRYVLYSVAVYEQLVRLWLGT